MTGPRFPLATRAALCAAAIALLASCDGGPTSSAPLAAGRSSAGARAMATATDFTPTPASYADGALAADGGAALRASSGTGGALRAPRRQAAGLRAAGATASLTAAAGAMRIYKNDNNWGLRDEYSAEALGLVRGTTFVVAPVSAVSSGIPAGTRFVLLTPNVYSEDTRLLENGSAFQQQLVDFLATGGVVEVDLADNLDAAGDGYTAPGATGAPDWVFATSCTDIHLSAVARGPDGVAGTADDHPWVKGPDGIAGTSDDATEANIDMEENCAAAHGNLAQGMTLPVNARILATQTFDTPTGLQELPVLAEYCYGGGRVLVHTFTTGYPDSYGASRKLTNLYAYALGSASDCQRPTATAGGPYTGAEGSPIALSLGAVDPDGEPLTYSWSFGDGVTGSGTDLPTSHAYPDNGSYTLTLTATDHHGASGTASATVTVTNVAPTVSGASFPSPLTLHGGSVTGTIANVLFTDPGANDGPFTTTIDCGNGTQADANGSCTWHRIGRYTVTVRVTDKDGGVSAPFTGTVSVLWSWSGFSAPVSNTTLNVVKAGSAVPLKFSLDGNQGLGVLAAGSPTLTLRDCGTGTPAGVAQAVTAGGSRLTYDAGSDQYNYVWKTDAAWGGSCGELAVALADGSVHRATFRFR